MLVTLALLAIPIYLFAYHGDKYVEVPEVATSTPQTAIEQVVEEVQSEPKELTAVELVDKYSEEYGADPLLAKAIIQCESGWVRTAQNSHSTASGFFQFIDGTWLSTMNRMELPLDTDKLDPVVSIQAGVWLLAEDGVSHWEASRHCWDR